jgi:hypothetical protein
VASYEFKITLDREKVRCEIDAPDGKRRTLEEGIQRKPHLETISVLEQWLKRWEWIAKARQQGQSLLVPETFRVLGDNLWNLALNNNIGRELIQAHLGMADEDEDEDEDSREPIMVRISFKQDASDLAALPWEYLRWPGSPDGGFFLASATNLVLGRFLGDFRNLDVRTSDLKVRALFVELLPQERECKLWEQHDEFRDMIERLSTIGDAFEIEKIYGWNPAEVARRLEDLKTVGKIIDVVHLVAVCEEGPGGPRLYLPEDGDPKHWHCQDPQPVVKALTEDNSTRPELVVLHLSDLHGTDPPAHFERLAPSFIKAGIPAVLAMQYPMTHPHGREFIYNFYRRLTKGEAIGEAVQAARHALDSGRQPNRHFGAPVLYMQSKVDCRLLSIRTAAETAYNVKPGTSPVHSELGLRRLETGRPDSIPQILLKDALVNSPDRATAEMLKDWINSVPTWPDDLNKVWRVLQGRLREKQDDPDQVTIYARWMGIVSDMLKNQREQ